MLKRCLILPAVLFLAQSATAAGVFDYPSTAREVAEYLPPLNSIKCEFTQEKTLKNKTLKSGGNFEFIKDKGAIFETLYPIKSTASYKTTKNKQMNEIIKAVSNKNFAYLDKNFNLYFKKENDVWTVGLKPKAGSAPASQLYDIIIKGKSDIDFIKISTIKNGTTEISFQQCTTN